MNESGTPNVNGQRPVYIALQEHQKSERWDMQDVARRMQQWTNLFVFHFKLEIPNVSLRLDWLRPSSLGHFRDGHNGFGLRREVAINRRHLQDQPFWDVLGTLLHELLHGWQEMHGKPGKGNYHNVEFQKKAASLGLIVDNRGRQSYAPEEDSRFLQLLKSEGVDIPEIPKLNPPRPKTGSNSTLKKWRCACTNVRVAVADFCARCLKCGEVFVRCDHDQAVNVKDMGRPSRKGQGRRSVLGLYAALRKKHQDRATPNIWWPIYHGRTEPPEFERLITNVLVRQNRWERVRDGVDNLAARDLLSAQAIAEGELDEIAESIRRTGLALSKARTLQNLCRFVIHRHGSERSFCERASLGELLKVKGVGPESAARIILYTCSRIAWPVDEYCLRVFDYHRFIRYPSSSRDRKKACAQIASMVHEQLPQHVEDFRRFHALMQLEGETLKRP